MKTIKRRTAFFVLFVLLSASSLLSQVSDSVDNGDLYKDSVASMEKFQKELSNKGKWIKVDSTNIDAEATDDNGDLDEDVNHDYVWVPDNMEPDWNPYSYGCWRDSDCGWIWISYYEFGWTTCHYGRWWWSPEYGWVWSPGYIWAPSWVNWCYSGGYVGWYPCSPRCRWRWDGSTCYNVSHVRCFDNKWVCVEKRNFDKSITKRVVLAPDKNYGIVHGNPVVNNTTIGKKGNVRTEGPNVKEIEKETGRKINNTVSVNKFNENNKNFVKDGGKNITGRRTDDTKVNDGNKKVRQNENGYSNNDNGKKKNNTNEKGYRTGDRGKKKDNTNYGTKHKTRNSNDGNYRKSNGRHRGDSGNKGNSKSNGKTGSTKKSHSNKGK